MFKSIKKRIENLEVKTEEVRRQIEVTNKLLYKIYEVQEKILKETKEGRQQ
jgi:hypothetical protein